MSLLQPGQTYIYEHADGVTYARIAGSHPSTRFPIGWDSKVDKAKATTWQEINAMAQTNETLRSELDRIFMLYYLLKKDIEHHSV